MKTTNTARFKKLLIWLGVAAGVTAGVLWGVRVATSVKEIRPRDGGVGAWESPRFADTDWPCWRGAAGANRGAGEATKTEWDKDAAEWVADVPGRGHSSPVVRGENLFLTTADADERVSLLCYDRRTGAKRWEAEVSRGGLMAKHEKNSHASGTPACDGERVYVATAVADVVRVTAVSEAGEVCWQRDAGPFVSEWGYGSSPVLCGPLVVVVGDNRGSKVGRLRATSFLSALDRRTGEIVWRVGRPEERSYGTPQVVERAGRATVLLAGPKGVFGYDGRDGREEWVVPWGPTRAANTPAVAANVAVASAGFPSKETVCFDLSASPRESVRWRSTSVGGDVPSPLIVGSRVYVAEDNGTVVCLATADGRVLWKERVASAGVSASPVEVGGVVFVCDEGGTVHTFRDDDEYDPITRCKLGEKLMASPAVSDGRMYIRTESRLRCFPLR